MNHPSLALTFSSPFGWRGTTPLPLSSARKKDLPCRFCVHDSLGNAQQPGSQRPRQVRQEKKNRLGNETWVKLWFFSLFFFSLAWPGLPGIPPYKSRKSFFSARELPPPATSLPSRLYLILAPPRHMRPRAPAVKVRPRVQFQKRRKMATTSQSFPIRSAPDGPEVASAPALSIPGLFTSQPILRDPLETSTSRIQDETVKECLPYLRGNSTRLDYNRHGVPTLTREKHKNFLKKNLRKLPAPYIAADASRPWMLLWNLAGLALLDEDISAYGPVLVDTAHTMQNRTGGFGGGHGQTSHLATTFACVLALACCGTQEAYDVIDRRAMWKWLCSLKQPNGGFQITYGGEVDVRYV